MKGNYKLKKELSFNPPFPSLTSEQRYHFDVYGYVLIEKAIPTTKVKRLKTALLELKKEFSKFSTPNEITIKNCRVNHSKTYTHFAHVLETNPSMIDYYADPKLIGMVQEVVGGKVRLEESEAIINSKPEPENTIIPPDYNFHTGTRPNYGTYIENGLFYCNFVKILTNLTELTERDGGTVVIAGSHKINLPQHKIIEAAKQNPKLIHKIVAPAGSTLLFPESLIHASGNIETDNERVVIIGGYTPPMFKAWPKQEPSTNFVDSLDPELRPLISGSDSWSWEPKFRPISEDKI